MILDKAKKIYKNANVAIGDDNSMRVHILECIAALKTFHEISISTGNEITKLLHNSFLNCVSEFTSGSSRVYVNEPAMDMFVNAVSHSKEWFPIHGMVACRHSTEKELQVVGRSYSDHRTKAIGATKVAPLHLAVSMRDPNLAIVRQLFLFSVRSGRAKDSKGDLPLHYAALYSNSIEVMQELLQAYPEGSTIKNDKGETFLHLLCRNTSPEAPAILRVVLAAVPNVVRTQNNNGDLPLHVVVGGDLSDAIRWDMAKQLISVYPEGAVVPNEEGDCPIHILVYRKSVGPILDMMLESHPAAACTANRDGCLPLHRVTDVDVARRLVTVYPEALYTNGPRCGSPLHQAAGRDNVEVFRYLYTCRPESLQETNDYGWRPIHYCSLSSLEMLRAVYELDPSAISAVDDFGHTPLFLLVDCNFLSEETPSADAMDRLYFLLDKYPAAASIPDISEWTPYDDDDVEGGEEGDTAYSVCHVNHTHARRLLLRAAPALDPEALHELNYSARRMALSLFYLSSQVDGQHTLFTKLSLFPNGRSLVRRVVEFL